MVYADLGINWVFPYLVTYEDDDILILKELPRVHKNDVGMVPIHKYITINTNYDTALVDGKVKLLEVTK